MSVHQVVGGERGRLTPEEIRTELGRLDLSGQAPLQLTARFLASRVGLAGGDLLHDAVRAALTSRSCPADVPVDQFITAVMRSAASTLARSRERQRENPALGTAEEISELLGIGPYSVTSAEELIERERVRELCETILDRLAAESGSQAALIDGVGFGLRGKELAEHLGVSLRELATLRRNLKRRVQRIWPEISNSL